MYDARIVRISPVVNTQKVNKRLVDTVKHHPKGLDEPQYFESFAYLPLMNVVSQAMNLTDCEKQIGMAVMKNTNESKFWVIVVPPTTTLSISQQIDAAKRFIKNVLTAVNKTTIKRKFMVIINASANEDMLLKNKLNNFVNITITKIQENYVVDF